MNFRVILFSLTSVFFLLSSCTKEVQIDIPGYEQQLVVDARIETDGFPIVLLSRSQNIYTATDLEAYLQSFVSDAQVSVNNGTSTVELSLFAISDLPIESRKTVAEMLSLELNEVSFLPIQVFSTTDPSIIGEVGKTYTLNITEQGKNYTAETSLLPITPLVNLYWKADADNSEYGMCWARMADPANEYNAFKWEAKRIKLNDQGQPYDVLFRRSFDPYFDDEYFNGLTFEFDTRYPERDTTYPENYRRHYKLGDSVVIKMSRLDRNVYDFFNKKDAQLSSSGNPFATPVNVPSNIVGGALGIWAGISPWYDTLYCVE
jgi:hypothetical protein